MEKMRGFTLVELLVTLAVAAILLTVAVPSFRDFVKTNRLRSVANDFITAVNMARNAAISRGQNATLCASSNQSTCNSTDWADGWLVWVDANGNGTLDSEEQVVTQSSLGNGITLASTSGATSYVFLPDGSTSAADALTLCDDRTGETGRAISISVTGHPSVADNTCS